MHIKWNRNLDGSRPSNQVGVVVVGGVAEENGSLDGGEHPEVVGDLMVCQQSSRDTLKSKTILANNLSTPKLEVPLLPPIKAETDTNNNSNSSSSSATMLMSKSTPSSLSSNSSSSLSRRHLPSKTTTAAAAALLVTPTNKLTSKGALTTLISLFRFRDDHNDLMVRGNSGLGGGGGGGAGNRSLSGRSLLRRRNHHSLERLNHLARENFYGTPAALEGKQTGERRRYSSMAALEARKSSLGTPTKSEPKSNSVQLSSKCDSKTSTTTTTASTGQTSRPSNTPTVTTRNPRSTPIISTTAVMLETPRKALVKFVNDEPASPECLAFWNEQNGSSPINVPSLSSSSTDHSPLPSADNLKSILRVRLASGDVGSGDGLGSRASSTLSSTNTSSSLSSSSSSSSSSSHSGSGALAKRVRFARPMATYSLIVVGEN